MCTEDSIAHSQRCIDDDDDDDAFAMVCKMKRKKKIRKQATTAPTT